MKRTLKFATIAAAIGFVCTAMMWAPAAFADGVAQAGLWQNSYGGGWTLSHDPSDGGEVVPGALLASCAGTSYTYEGTTYKMSTTSTAQTWAYSGVMHMQGGVTYRFVKNYDDAGGIVITDPLTGVKTTVINNTSWSHVTYGTYTPARTGYYPIYLAVYNSGAGGPTQSPFKTAEQLGAGLAWTSEPGITDCTTSNYSNWHKFMNDPEADPIFYTDDPAAVRILPIDDQFINWGEAATPAVVVSNVSTHAVYAVAPGEANEFFDISYDDNTVHGDAMVTVTGKAGGIYEGLSVSRLFKVITFIIIRATADGVGDGSSWESPMSWSAALATAAADVDVSEVWLKGDVTIGASPSTITFKGSTTIYGGFAGTETAVDQRPGVNSVITGNEVYDLLLPSVSSGATLHFDGITFTKGKMRAFKKSGTGDIRFTNCSLSGNGRTIGHNSSDMRGCAIWLTGGGQATLENCRIEGNGPINYCQEQPGGIAIRSENLARLTIDNCQFLTNGLWLAGGCNNWHASPKGSTMYLTGTPITMRNSRVSGSISLSTSGGGVIYLENGCGGSAFTNCVFSGNQDAYCERDSGGNPMGVFVVNLSAIDNKVDFSGCTFAYNLTRSKGQGCLAIHKGDVHVTDSTFFYNLLGHVDNHTAGSDISVNANGRLSIERTHLNSLVSSISSANPANLTIDLATMTAGNPCFKTSPLEVEAMLDYKYSTWYTKSQANWEKLVDIDATPLEVKPVKPDLGAGNIVYVAADATGSADGTSWANAFTDLSSALAVASPVKNEIWVKGDLTMSADGVWTLIETNLVIRGGFSGSENSPSDRSAGAKSTIDGGKAYDLVRISVLADAAVVFDGFTFTRGKYRAINKRGFGDLRCENCRFLNNGTDQKASGRGIYSPCGCNAANLELDHCEFAGQKYKQRDSSTGYGAAVYAGGLKRLTCDDSLFCSNGVPILTSTADNRNVKGSVMYLMGSPLTMRNTRVAANGGASRESAESGGIVRLDGYSADSALTNCAFVGNYASRHESDNNACGAFVFKPSDASQKLDIESCTFAYNISHGNQSPGGLNILTGNVKIHNSIFWHNLHGFTSAAGYAHDIDAKAGTTVVSHSIVTGTGIDCCRGAASRVLTLDEGTVYTDDPGFVTSYDDFAAKVNFGASYANPGSGFNFDFLGSLDVHLISAAGYWLNDGSVGPSVSRTSIAIDKGDPASDYSNEPEVNGERINLGAYGNTAHASKTPTGQPRADAFTIAYPDGYTRPKASLTLGLASGESYNATVTMICRYDNLPVASKTFESCQNGDVIEWMPPKYFNDNTPLEFEYIIDAVGATECSARVNTTVTGTVPAFVGKGGGPNVIHVRAGADCLMDGTSWTDAFPNVDKAFAAAGPGKTEIWIAIDTMQATCQMTLTAPLTVRGGFAGTENSAAERTGDWQTEFNFANALIGLQFTNGADCPLELDRIKVKQATNRGLQKSGAGALVLNNFGIYNCGRSNTNNGRGLYMDGGSLAATNCVFEGNYTTNDGDNPGSGGGAYITGCSKVIFEGCLFHYNGISFRAPNATRTGSGVGGAIYLYNTPIICRNTRFTANCTGSYGNGGIVSLNGNCNGSVFDHCAFVGNYESQHWSGASSAKGGPLAILMDSTSRRVAIKSCTFAYNINSSRTACGGVNIWMGTATIEDSIFFGNRRTSHVQPETSFPAPEDIYVQGDGYLYMTNVILRDAYTGTDRLHCLQTANAAHLTTNSIITVEDALFVSSTNDVRALMTNPDGYAYYPSSSIAALKDLNVHLRGGSGYIDEHTGLLVDTYRYGRHRPNSPAIDAGRRVPEFEPQPNGKLINLGCYGDTPWATMSPLAPGFMLRLK